MIVEAIREATYKPVEIDPSLAKVLGNGRENPFPEEAHQLLAAIDELGLPDLESDKALLVAFYYYSLGDEVAIKTMKAHFGDDVGDRLGITIGKRGTPEKPGMKGLIETAFGEFLREFKELQSQLPRIKLPIERTVKKPSILSP